MFWAEWPKSGLPRAAVMLLLLGIVGCATTSQPANSQAQRTQSQPAVAASTQQADPNAIPPMKANLAGATFTFTDPKTGKLLWTATAGSVDAHTGTGANSAEGDLHDVSGVMYHDGIATDRVRATDVTADQASRTIVAIGNVRISTIGASTTTMECDRMIWNMNGDKILGLGNVVCRKTGFTQSAPSFEADTRMRTIVMPAPSAVAGRSPQVHAMFNNGVLKR
jgi:hypothetical protein